MVIEESALEQITQLILECKGSGTFLPYSDYALINEWIKKSSNREELMIILSEVLPEYFTGDNGSKKRLSGVNKLVLACIKDRAMRR